MSNEKIPITKEGYEKLCIELTDLKNRERPAVIAAIAEARSHGDLKENAEYAAAKEKQSFIEAKISDLEARVTRAEIIDTEAIESSKVQFGAIIVLLNEETDEEVSYKIVGDYEADLSKRKISVTSPIARAMLGKIVGDHVEFSAPSGTKYYEIISISYK